MRRVMYALVAFTGLLGASQSVKADWVPKVNPQGTIDYWYDPSHEPPRRPPYTSNWFIMCTYTYEYWVAYDLGWY